MILVSPTEPASVLTALTNLGARFLTHSLPELQGADYLLCTPAGMVGIQRKAIPNDLLSSVEDGRLYNGLVRLVRLDVPILVLEGEFAWSTDGHLLNRNYSRFTRLQVRNLLRTVQLQGIKVEHTDSPQDTALLLTEMEAYFEKASHDLLLRRPKHLPRTEWGTATDADYQLFLLQGLPTIGPTLAKNIIKHFGTIPWAWTCSVAELAKVPGLGKSTAEKVYRALAYVLTDQQLCEPIPPPQPKPAKPAKPAKSTKPAPKPGPKPKPPSSPKPPRAPKQPKENS